MESKTVVYVFPPALDLFKQLFGLLKKKKKTTEYFPGSDNKYYHILMLFIELSAVNKNAGFPLFKSR